MDITWHTFESYLQKVLDDLATCCFVSIDLEFSGIPWTQKEPGTGPQTLQDRYAETRTAAEKYQVLQIGLTICHEDTEKGEIYRDSLIEAFVIKLYSIVHFETVQHISESNHRPQTGP